MPINLKSFPPITWGCDYARLLQGVNIDGTKPTAANPAPLLSSDTLAATISLGQNLPSLFSPTVTWFSPTLAQVSFAITGAQSATLSIDTQYLVVITASRGGVTYPLVEGYLPVLPAAGSQGSAAPPDLVTIPYAAQMLQVLNLPEPLLEAVPTLISAASSAIRKYCARSFTQAQYVELLPVELDGTIRLREIPINQVLRIQCYPSVALTVSNAVATSAWVNQSFTGSIADNLAVTGMVLNWQSGGATSSQAIAYTSNMTIAALAAAINAVGSGWVATADPVLGAWPVTEIYDGTSSKGASPTDEPDGAALFSVYAENVTNARPVADDGERTGIWWVGRQSGPDTGPRWGPDWAAWDVSNAPSASRCRVSYNGGFAIVPYEVQLATVELVKHQLERLKTELLLSSEGAADYNYQINDAQVMALPRHVLQGLSRYRVTNA